MALSNAVIELTGVSKGFGRRGARKLALDSVTLTVNEGEVLGLFGNNGAGKSTFLRIVAGLLLQDVGTCTVNGLDTRRHLRRVRSQVGLCGADERSFYGRLTGRQNLRLFGRLHGVRSIQAKTRENWLLELLGLAAHADRPVQTYSTGLQQRLNVARALLHDPPILLLDEATKAADPGTSDLIRATIRDHWAGKGGKTVLYVSQDLYGIESLCDRVAILDRGTIVRMGALREVLGSGHRDLRHLLRSMEPQPE
jgi:ABC-2 type transport system ATP-binding protein